MIEQLEQFSELDWQIREAANVLTELGLFMRLAVYAHREVQNDRTK